MIVDSSAVVAIAFDEPERPMLLEALLSAKSVAMAAPTRLEVSIVLLGTGFDPTDFLSIFEREFGVEYLAFSRAHSESAVDGWMRYGKGRHPAGLNFGDCISYATAKLAGETLLYVGDDFARTDIAAALAPRTD